MEETTDQIDFPGIALDAHESMANLRSMVRIAQIMIHGKHKGPPADCAEEGCVHFHLFMKALRVDI